MATTYLKEVLSQIITAHIHNIECEILFSENLPYYAEILTLHSKSNNTAELSIALDLEHNVTIWIGKVLHDELGNLDYDRLNVLKQIEQLIVHTVRGDVREEIWWWNTRCVRYEVVVGKDNPVIYKETYILTYVISKLWHRVERNKYSPYPQINSN